MSGSVLRASGVGRPFVGQTDACDLGIGAVLSQLDENDEERPVAYAGQKLLPLEIKYVTIDRVSRYRMGFETVQDLSLRNALPYRNGS